MDGLRDGGGGPLRVDLRGDAMLWDWYGTDGRRCCNIGRRDQDMMLLYVVRGRKKERKKERKRDEEAVDNMIWWILYRGIFCWGGR